MPVDYTQEATSSMRILLLSMPDAIPLFYAFRSHVPNLGIRSIAGNVSAKGALIKYIDLVFFHKSIGLAVKRGVIDFKPNLVGISAMTFQYETALKIMEMIKRIDGRIKIALGGYHATAMYDEISQGTGQPFDFIIRNEGEESFDGLVKALIGGGKDLSTMKGVSFKKDGEFIHNEKGSLLNLDKLKPPRRDLRLFDHSREAFGRVEAVETSRGCVMGCTFCSISNMYGRSFRKFSVERVVNDIRAAKEMGANRILFTDDNATLDGAHLERICEGIIGARLNDLYYGIQLSSRGIASNEQLVKKMREANFGIVFLGIENVSRANLRILGKGDIIDDTKRAISYLHKYDIGIMGGFILGNPNDDLYDIKACFSFAKKAKVDILMVQYPTPYPKTALRDQLLKSGLVEHKEDYSRYNGFQAIARTESLSLRQLERCIVRLNILWYLTEVFNPSNWFVRSKRVFRHVYLRLIIMTFGMIIDFARGRYGKSFHKI